MNQDEALKQAQREIWVKGTFFQSEMAQYAIQLGFEKGSEWKEKQMIEYLYKNIQSLLEDYGVSKAFADVAVQLFLVNFKQAMKGKQL